MMTDSISIRDRLLLLEEDTRQIRVAAGIEKPFHTKGKVLSEEHFQKQMIRTKVRMLKKKFNL